MSGRVAVGHPVDVATGVVFETYTDLNLPGQVALRFARFYSTGLVASDQAAGIAGPLGPGWRHSFEMSLRRNLDGWVFEDHQGNSVQLSDHDDRFAREGRLQSATRAVELRYDKASGQIELFGYIFGRERYTLRFAPVSTYRYRLAAITASPRSRLDLEYDVQGRLARVFQRREGRVLEFVYDGPRLIKLTLISGAAKLGYHYDYDAAGMLAAVSDGARVPCNRYEYDAHGWMLNEINATAGDHTFVYDARGRCVRASGPDNYNARTLSFDPGGTETIVRDSHGHAWTYAYNQAGQVVALLTPSGALFTYAFDADGRIVCETFPNGAKINTEYDALGRRAAMVLPDGTTMRWGFDDEHRMIAHTQADGSEWAFERDAEGRMIAVRSADDGTTWRYEYDGHGALTRQLDPLGHAQHWSYDERGNQITFVDQRGGIERRRYDDLGLVIATVEPDGGEHRYEYDEQHRLVAMTMPGGQRWTWAYGPTTLRVTEPNGHHRTVEYNACGLPLRVRDETGSVTEIEWDSEPGRLLSLRRDGAVLHRCEYDQDGRVVRIRDPRGGETINEWKGEWLVAATGTDGVRFEYEYDIRGKLVARHGPDGTLSYEWDALGQLSAATSEQGVRLAYERRGGHVVREQQGALELLRGYDELGRMTKLESAKIGELGYRFDPDGWWRELSHADARVRAERDVCGRELVRELGAGRIEFEWASGRLQRQRFVPSSAAAAAHERSYQYDPAGFLLASASNHAGTRHVAHSPRGELAVVFDDDGDAWAFSYDALGNRVRAGHLPGRGAVMPAVPQSGIASADAVTRLIDWMANSGGEVEDTTYSGNNQLVRVDRRDRRIDCEYSPAGYLVHKRVLSKGPDAKLEAWRYEWSAAGQLRAVIDPIGQRWEYRYDALNRRVAKLAPDGSETAYLWDGPHLLAELRPDGTRVWLRDPNTARVLGYQDDAEGRRWIVDDLAGRPTEVYDEQGRLTWQSGRDPWTGDARDPRAEHEHDPGVRFLGQLRDLESGLHYNTHRYYDPELGRYISPDPLGLQAGLNDYAWVSSPLEYMDPYGLALNAPAYRTPGPYFHNPNAGEAGVVRTSASSHTVSAPDGTRSRVRLTPANGRPRNVFITVSNGDTPVFNVYNGVPANGEDFFHGMPDAMADARGLRPATSMHAEPAAFMLAHRHAGDPRMAGDGPIRLTISYQPCTHGCAHTVPGMAQALADSTGRRVEVHYTDVDGNAHAHRYNPSC